MFRIYVGSSEQIVNAGFGIGSEVLGGGFDKVSGGLADPAAVNAQRGDAMTREIGGKDVERFVLANSFVAILPARTRDE